MRVLFVSNLYPPHDLGGWEQNLQEMVVCLQARGHVCHVLTSRHGVRSKPTPEAYVTRALCLEANIDYYRPFGFWLRRPAQERTNRRVLRRVLDAFEPDIVFVWGMWNLSTQVPYWAEQGLPGHVAYAIAGYWPMEPDVHEAYWRLSARSWWSETLKRLARHVALRTLVRDKREHTLLLEHVACVSEHVRRRLTEAGALPHGARVIYNGIEPEPFVREAQRRRSVDGVFRLVYSGSLVAHKGVHTSIEAMGLLRQRGGAQRISLTVVGGGHPAYEAMLHERVEELGLCDLVRFRGRVARSQMASILAEHDAFLFTSIYEEPIARSVMEAMAAGLAVIATSVGGQSEMLEAGENALVFPPNDPDALAHCILRASRDASLCARLSRAGRNSVLTRFTLGHMVDQVETWLKEMVA